MSGSGSCGSSGAGMNARKGADTHAVLSLVFTGIALFAPCDQSFYPSLWRVALPDSQGDVLIDDGGEIDGRVVTDGGDVEGEQRGKGLGEVEGDNGEGVGGSPLASVVKRVPSGIVISSVGRKIAVLAMW